MSDKHQQGICIAIEPASLADPDMARYPAHLLSNIAAAMTLGDIPSRDAVYAKAQDQHALPMSWDDYGVGDDIQPDWETDFTDAESITQGIDRLRTAVTAGKIVVTYKVMSGVDECLRFTGDTLNVERFLHNEDFRPDLVLVLHASEDTPNKALTPILPQLVKYANTHRERVVEIAYSPEHQVMCDAVWAVCYRFLRKEA